MIDPAIFACSQDNRWNAFFRMTNYQNTIVIDGQNQPRHINSSDWLKPNPSCVKRWLSAEQFEFVQSTTVFNKGLAHNRLLFAAKEDYWLVLDDLKPAMDDNSTHWFNQYWYLTPGAVGLDQHGRIHLERQEQKFDLVQQVWKSVERLKINTRILDGTGELKQPVGWNATRTAPTIVHSFTAAEPLLSTALIYAENDKLGAVLNISRLPAHDTAIVMCLQFENATDYFYYNPQPENAATVRFGDFSFSGDFCHVRLDRNGRTSGVSVAPRISNLTTNFNRPDISGLQSLYAVS